MACTDMAIRLEVDGLATGSSASTKTRSLELLLVLHSLLGAAVLQRTNECSSSGRTAQRLLPKLDGCTAGAPENAFLKLPAQPPTRSGAAAAPGYV